jgi:hypothetical protein
MPKAKAIFWPRVFPLLLLFIIKKSAVAKLAVMAMNAMMTKYFMLEIIC